MFFGKNRIKRKIQKGFSKEAEWIHILFVRHYNKSCRMWWMKMVIADNTRQSCKWQIFIVKYIILCVFIPLSITRVLRVEWLMIRRYLYVQFLIKIICWYIIWTWTIFKSFVVFFYELTTYVNKTPSHKNEVSG